MAWAKTRIGLLGLIGVAMAVGAGLWLNELSLGRGEVVLWARIPVHHEGSGYGFALEEREAVVPLPAALMPPGLRAQKVAKRVRTQLLAEDAQGAEGLLEGAEHLTKSDFHRVREEGFE